MVRPWRLPEGRPADHSLLAFVIAIAAAMVKLYPGLAPRDRLAHSVPRSVTWVGGWSRGSGRKPATSFFRPGGWRGTACNFRVMPVNRAIHPTSARERAA